MHVDMVVPPGCSARVLLPGVDPYELGPGAHHAVVLRPRDTTLSLLSDAAEGQA
jgi:hypothetical protein